MVMIVLRSRAYFMLKSGTKIIIVINQYFSIPIVNNI